MRLVAGKKPFFRKGGMGEKADIGQIALELD